MKIKSIDHQSITFTDGQTITHEHDQDCCETNYADFSNAKDEIGDYDFESPLLFEAVKDYGFRFGDSRTMFSIPCYSCQNGYYSSDVDILYNGKKVLNVYCQVDDSW